MSFFYQNNKSHNLQIFENSVDYTSNIKVPHNSPVESLDYETKFYIPCQHQEHKQENNYIDLKKAVTSYLQFSNKNEE